MEYQLDHQEIQNSHHTKEIVLMADNLQRPSNYGMMTRIAEGLGVKKVLFISQEYNQLTRKMKRSSRATENNLEILFDTAADVHLQKYKALNYHILGLESTNHSQNINDIQTISNKIVLLIGNEANGLSPEWIAQTDQCVHLPMYGKNSSMNVVMATGIALWQFVHM